MFGNTFPDFTDYGTKSVGEELTILYITHYRLTIMYTYGDEVIPWARVIISL
jgi:hypothetical protein